MQANQLARLARAPMLAAAAATGLALAACDRADDKALSAGTHLDDSVITAKVKTALSTDAQAQGMTTSVETRKGAVILSGFVDSRAQADREVELARAVEGVASVDSKLMVKEGTATAGNALDDSVVTVKVKSALLSDDKTRGDDIAVSTRKGVVQLSGYVVDGTAQARAGDVAGKVEGVRQVVNDTKIKQ